MAAPMRQSPVAAAESPSYHAARQPARPCEPRPFPAHKNLHKRRIAMLIAMKSKVAKWVLSGIMVLVGGGLIVSLGFGDLFTGRVVVAPVIQVGDAKLYREQVDREFSNLTDQVSDAFGTPIDADRARAMGLMDSAVQTLVNRTLYDNYVADLGLVASDSQAMSRLASEPGLVDSLGNIDIARLNEMMRRSNLSEAGLIETLRREIMRDQILIAATAGARAHDTLVDLIYGYRAEKRAADTLLLAIDRFPEPTPPDDATLAAWHEANSDQFMAPEYRSIEYLLLTTDSLADTVLLDEARLRDEYDARRALFDQPERRAVEQIVFSDMDTAGAAVDRIDAGEDFAAVARELTGSGPIDLGEMEMTDLTGDLAVLVETAFAAETGVAAGPVETPLGVHVIRVNAVTPAHSPTFEEVRDLLEQELRQQIAVDRMIEAANLVDDEIAGGASLAEAASAAGLNAVALDAVDADGNDPAGNPAVPGDPDAFIADLAFRTETGETSLLNELPDGSGYAIVQVHGATEPMLRPLGEVRADVLAAWSTEERLRLAEEKANAIADRVNAGIALATIAEEEGLTISTSSPLTRSQGDSAANLPSSLTSGLFLIDPGTAIAGPVNNGFVVAVLGEIVPADPVAEAELVEALRDQMKAGATGDIVTSMATALRERYPVKIDEAALEADQLF
jgi:peptidyl-prolyl cis-trans isomerase D